MKDYYAILGVAPDAPQEVIRAAYQVLIKMHHPDRGGNAASAATAAEINNAYRVLSDPAGRAAYDAAARGQAPAVASTVARARSPVRVVAANHAVDLRFVPGTVLSSDVWAEETTTARGGGGFTFAGFGYSRRAQVNSRSTTKQRIGVRTAGADLFVDHIGPSLPVAPGQAVELVQATLDRSMGRPYIALINRSLGQWFWTASQVDAGALVRTSSARLLDGIAYISFVAALAFVLWLAFVRDGGFFVWLAFVVLGVPVLLGGCTPLLFRTANKIGAALRAAISTAAGAAR